MYEIQFTSNIKVDWFSFSEIAAIFEKSNILLLEQNYCESNVSIIESVFLLYYRVNRNIKIQDEERDRRRRKEILLSILLFLHYITVSTSSCRNSNIEEEEKREEKMVIFQKKKKTNK